jgi:LPXTG-motif cell wall-anchored protein
MFSTTPRPSRSVGAFALAVLGLISLMAAFIPGVAGAAAVTPAEQEFPGGEPVCAEGEVGFRIGAPGSGSHTDGDVEVDITVHSDEETGPTFDFVVTSDHLVTTVFVKGGSDQNVYSYPAPGVSADTGLHAPVNPANDKFFGLSHIDFCFVEPEEEEEPPTTTPPATTPPTTTPPVTEPPVVETTVPAPEAAGEVVETEVLQEQVEATPAPATLPRTGAGSAPLAAAGLAALLSGVGVVRASRRAEDIG